MQTGPGEGGFMELDKILVLQEAGVDTEGALRRFSGNSALYERFLKKFLDDTTFSLVTEAFDKTDVEAALSSTHTFKGLTANLGMMRLYDISSEMVKLIREDKFEEAHGIYPRLKAAYEEICGILR